MRVAQTLQHVKTESSHLCEPPHLDGRTHDFAVVFSQHAVKHTFFERVSWRDMHCQRYVL